ncbi:MAG: YceI family protein [Phycisphaerae bacterium]
MTCGRAFLVATLTAFVVAGGAGRAAAAEYKIDPDHSTVIFKVKSRDVSYVYGRFNSITGTIVVDNLRKPSKLEFNVEIKAKSLDTNNKERDRELKGADFFNTAKKPLITFKTKAVKKLEENMFEITGELSLLGITKELTVIFEQIGLKKVNMTFRLGGQSTFTIKRSDFGMTHMLSEIADEVTVIANIEGGYVIPPSG